MSGADGSSRARKPGEAGDESMHELIVLSFPRESTAARVMTTVREMEQEELLEIDRAVVVVRDEHGKATYQTQQARPSAGRGAAWGGVWGLLIGSLFLTPVAGVALGAGMGALAGKLNKVALDQSFKTRVEAALRPGTSMVILFLDHARTNEIVERLKRYEGTVLKTNLSEADEQAIQEALAGRTGDRGWHV